MRQFAEIETIAARRHGGPAALEAMIAGTTPDSPADIAALPDSRVLERMTKRVFYSGFARKVIDAKWDGFVAAFDGFDPHANAMMSDEKLDTLLRNPAIVRNGAKIASVQRNAQFVLDLAEEHGSAARFFADWPDDRYVELLRTLHKRGNRLGGDTGARFLRDIGKPAFVLTPDVVAALIREAVVDKAPTSRADLANVQDAFNTWSRQSGRNLTHVSRILALSVGA